MTAKAAGLLPSRPRARQLEIENMRRAMMRYRLGGGTLTASNVITDANRTAALSWGVNQQGGQTDGATTPAGFFIGRTATNLFRAGQCDSLTGWGQTGSGTVTRTLDATTAAPFSPQSVKSVADGTATPQGIRADTATGLAAVAGVVGAGSVCFKGAAGQSYECLIQWTNTDSTATNGTSLSFTATGAWQQLAPSSVAVASGKTGDRLAIIVRTVGAARVDTSWAAHAMLESGQAVVAPYVATSGGATATKADSALELPATTAAQLLGRTNDRMWIAFAVTMGYASSQVPVAGGGVNQTLFADWSNGLGQPRVAINTSGANTLRIQRSDGSTIDAKIITATWAAGDTITCLAYVTPSEVGIAYNGGAFTTAAGNHYGSTASNKLRLGWGDSSIYGSCQIDSRLRWWAMGVGTPRASDTAVINGFGATPPKPWQLPRHLLTTAVMQMVTTAYDLS